MGSTEGDEKNQPSCIELEELGGAFTQPQTQKDQE